MAIPSKSERPLAASQSLNVDIAIAVGLTAAALIAYTSLSQILASGPLFTEDNLAFDFDASRYTRIWCESPLPQDQVTPQFIVRHPLVLAVRPACQAMTTFGASTVDAALLIQAFFLAVSTGLVFACGRAMDVARPFAVGAALLFASSSSALFLAAIPEAYGPATTGLLLQCFAAICLCRGRAPHFAVRVAIGVWNFGVTITNLGLSLITEFVVGYRRGAWLDQARHLALYAVSVLAIGVLASWLLSAVFLSEGLTGTEAARNLWWAANMPIDYRQSPPMVIATFAVSSVVSPEFTEVQIGAGAHSRMLDFRTLDSGGPLGLAAVVAWLLVLGLSIYAALRDKELRSFWLIVAAWFVFNVALHSVWQLRGSIFLYASHPHVAVMMLPLALGRASQARQGWRWPVIALLAVTVPVVLAANLHRFWEMAALLSR